MAFIFLFGIASTSMVAFSFYLKAKMQNRSLQRKNKKQRKELNKLRSVLTEKE